MLVDYLQVCSNPLQEGEDGSIRRLEINLKEYRVPSRHKATNLCLVLEKMREGKERQKKKSLIPGFLAHSNGLGKRLFRTEKAREKSYSFTLYKSQLTGNAWWSCRGSLNMNSLGGGQGGWRGGRDGWGGGSGFQQVVSKENRKPGTKRLFLSALCWL